MAGPRGRPGRASGVDAAAGAGTADAGSRTAMDAAGAGLLLLVLVGGERESEGTRVVGDGGSRSTASWRSTAGALAATICRGRDRSSE